MAAKHKNPFHSNTKDNAPEQEDEKLFDFDRGSEQQDINEAGADGGKIQELESSVNELKEKHLRLLAEFDNYKKRTSRERYELLNTASKNVLLALLPVIDDFERAIKVGEANHDESHTEGIRMIYNRLVNVMQSQGLKAMESTNETFDPDLHEAITEVPVEDPALKGKVIETVEKGYWLHDKIIRHAKVVVGN
jgi:molecular chaperone GrpE